MTMKTIPFSPTAVRPGDEVAIRPRAECFYFGPYKFLSISSNNECVFLEGRGGNGFTLNKSEVLLIDRTEPKIVPYDETNVPLDAWFRHIEATDALRITRIHKGGVEFDGFQMPWVDLLERWERVDRIDGKWVVVGPAGIQEGESK